MVSHLCPDDIARTERVAESQFSLLTISRLTSRCCTILNHTSDLGMQYMLMWVQFFLQLVSAANIWGNSFGLCF